MQPKILTVEVLAVPAARTALLSLLSRPTAEIHGVAEVLAPAGATPRRHMRQLRPRDAAAESCPVLSGRAPGPAHPRGSCPQYGVRFCAYCGRVPGRGSATSGRADQSRICASISASETKRFGS